MAASAFQTRWERSLGWSLAAALLANAAVGIFPLAAIEGDDLGVITGLREMLLGASGQSWLGYAYELQPGTYRTLLGLQFLTQQDPGLLYLVTSATAAAVFLFIAGWLAHRWLSISLSWGLVAVALAQELVSAAAYANSSTLGGCLVVAGIAVLELRPRWSWPLAGALIAAGGWCRLDALALAPLTVIVFARRQSLRPALKSSCAIAAIAAIVLLTLLWLSGVSPGAIRHTIAGKSASVDLSQIFATTYPLHSATGLALAGIGFLWALWRREYWLPTAVIVVFVPLLLVHRNGLESTKYLYYGVLPLTWCAASTLVEWHRRQSRQRIARAALLSATLALGLEYFTCVRRSENPVRRWHPIVSFPLVEFSGPGGAPYVWAFGAGEAISGGDGFRLRFGHAFAPWLWHRQKQATLVESERIAKTLTVHRHATIVTSTYFSFRVVASAARSQGLVPGKPTYPNPLNSATEARTWVEGDRQFEIVLINHNVDRFAEFRTAIERAGAGPVYFANDMGKNYATTLLQADSRAWRLLSSDADSPVTLYRRE